MTSQSFPDLAPIRLGRRSRTAPQAAGRSAAVERQLGLSALLVAATLAAVLWNGLPEQPASPEALAVKAPAASHIFDTSKGVRRL
jgi:hypothetical protein